MTELPPLANGLHDPREEYHRRLGMVATLMTQSLKYRHYALACLTVWIEAPILLNQIHCFRDDGGHLIGYVTWAMIADDTEKRLIHDPNVLFHFSEWNEGQRLWIMDFVLIEGNIREIIKQAFALFPSFSEARSLRRNCDGTVRKVIIWRRHHAYAITNR